ncbi:MAG: C-GCAxxG-C-C family protein [Thermoplasmatota archaeon]
MTEKIDDLQEAAYRNEKKYGNCAQGVCGAFLETFGFPSKEVFKSSCGLYGGVGLYGNSCGALNGAIVVISYLSGREYDDYEGSTPDDCTDMSKEIVKRFKDKYGSINCRDIQKETIGRSFDFWDEEEAEAFGESKGPEEACPNVVKRSAKWTAEILEEYDYI